MKGFRHRGFPPLAEAVVSANLIGQDPFHENHLALFNFLHQVNASFWMRAKDWNDFVRVVL